MNLKGQLFGEGKGELHDAFVLLVEGAIESLDPWMPVLALVHTTGRSVLIVAGDMEEAAVAEVDRLSYCTAIQGPGFGDRRRAILEDIAVVTGTEVMSSAPADPAIERLGQAGRIEVGPGTTVLVDGRGERERIRTRVDKLRVVINETASDYDRENTEERVANMLLGIEGGEASLPASRQRLEPKPSPMEPWWAARRLARNWGVLIVGLGLLVAGIVAGKVFETDVSTAAKSKGWPSVQGEILSSKIGVRQRRNEGVNKDVSFPEVVYSYTVDDKRHEGSRIRFHHSGRDAFLRRSQVEELIAGYPVGKTVPVYYDPGDPSESVLEPGAQHIERTTGWFYVLFVVAGSLSILAFVVARVTTLARRLSARSS
jgi:hypothetical protein